MSYFQHKLFAQTQYELDLTDKSTPGGQRLQSVRQKNHGSNSACTVSRIPKYQKAPADIFSTQNGLAEKCAVTERHVKK